jgi:hypothetical protein
VAFDKSITNAWREDFLVLKAIKECLESNKANIEEEKPFGQALKMALPDIKSINYASYCKKNIYAKN